MLRIYSLKFLDYIYFMKTLLSLLLLFLPILFFGQSNDGLSFEFTSHDFGTISSNSDAVVKFSFTNTSTKDIEISKILGQNQCIEIDSSSLKRYSPKEKGVISVTYDTSCVGPIRKTLSVFTSNNETSTLKLTGKVIE